MNAKKTIIVVYTPEKLTEQEASKKKRYAFNTKGKVEVGDMFEVDGYNCPVQVVEILTKQYKYVNVIDGSLKNEVTSTRDYPLREIVLVFKSKSVENLTYGYRV